MRSWGAAWRMQYPFKPPSSCSGGVGNLWTHAISPHTTICSSFTRVVEPVINPPSSTVGSTSGSASTTKAVFWAVHRVVSSIRDEELEWGFLALALWTHGPTFVNVFVSIKQKLTQYDSNAVVNYRFRFYRRILGRQKLSKTFTHAQAKLHIVR